MSMIQTRKIPSITHNHHLARNALLSLGQQIRLPLGGKEMIVKFLSDSVKIRSVADICLTLNGAPFIIRLQHFFFADYLKSKYPDTVVTELPQQVQNALIELAFEDILSFFEKKFHKDLSVQHFNHSGSSDSSFSLDNFIAPKEKFQFSFSLTEKGTGSEILGNIETDNAGLRVIHTLLEQISPDFAQREKLSVQARIPLIIGQTRLTQQDLRNLAKEDVILCDKAFYTLHHENVLGILPKLGAFMGHLSGQTLTIDRLFEKEISMGDEDDDFDLDEFLSDDFDEDEEDEEDQDEDDHYEDEEEDEEILNHLEDEDDHMDLDEPTENLAAMPSMAPTLPEKMVASPMQSAKSSKASLPVKSLNALPVKLAFELTTLNMPLAKVESLKEGQQIDIGIDLNSPITIKANGKNIGKGQLVQIEKKIGIQVLELFE